MARCCLACLHRMRHACASARVAAGGPDDFASAVLRVDQYDCLGRQGLRRVSSLAGEVTPNGICRVCAGWGRKRASQKIDTPAGVTRRITGVSAELRRAEVPRSAPPRREGPVLMLGIEGPDIEVLDAVPAVHVVQGSTLAQSPAQETTGIPAGAMRIPPEEPGLGVSGQRGESKEVGCFDPRQRPIHVRGHAAMLSQVPEPSDAATIGVLHMRTSIQPVIRPPKTM
jgi:hypothetical protein